MSSDKSFEVLEKCDIVAVFLKHHQNGYFCNDSSIIQKYELNQKLFEIHEPYLMKTEREAFMNLEEKLQNIKKTNLSSKRKRSLFKKMDLIRVNLNQHEFEVVDELLKECLKQTYSETNKNLFMDSKSTNIENLILKTESLLNQLKSSKSECNYEAQDFVYQLFQNRFQAQNYSNKVYRNVKQISCLHRFGMIQYIIPANCSFASKDIIEGVQELKKFLILGSIQIEKSTDPFFILMDPAWQNKSIKRLKTYDTVERGYLDQLSQEISELIKEILNKISDKKVSCSIWTTHAELDYTLTKMIPTMKLSTKFIFKWHKITTQGCPVKIHGGLEYLVIADNDLFQNNIIKKGVLISIPSAIHSHKPPLFSLLNWIYKIQIENEQNLAFSKENFENTLEESKIISSLKGVELFARYLTSGFHSIGKECIHLNAEKLYCFDV